MLLVKLLIVRNLLVVAFGSALVSATINNLSTGHGECCCCMLLVFSIGQTHLTNLRWWCCRWTRLHRSSCDNIFDLYIESGSVQRARSAILPKVKTIFAINRLLLIESHTYLPVEFKWLEHAESLGDDVFHNNKCTSCLSSTSIHMSKLTVELDQVSMVL